MQLYTQNYTYAHKQNLKSQTEMIDGRVDKRGAAR